MRLRFMGLWHHRDFMKLWIGQTISDLGTELGALEFTAILFLQASPLQIGLLGALRAVPVLLVGLPAGVWVDRLRRRPMLIGADIGRALLLISIPIAAAVGRLGLTHLYLVAFGAGALAVLFSVASRAYLPSLIGPDDLLEGNSKLGASGSAAEAGGQAVGGALVQLASAPVAVLIDALSFLASALCLGLIRTRERPPVRNREQESARREIAEGVRVVLGSPALRGLAGAAVTGSFFGNMIGATYSLFLLRDLGVSPFVLGITVAAGGVGAVVGAFLAEPAGRRVGVGPAILVASVISSLFSLLLPAAAGPVALAVLIILVAQLFGDLARSVRAINETTLLQRIAPPAALGRASASMQVMEQGVMPLGLIVGGVLGELFGLRVALTVAVTGLLLANLWLVFSPIRQLRVVAVAGSPHRPG